MSPLLDGRPQFVQGKIKRDHRVGCALGKVTVCNQVRGRLADVESLFVLHLCWLETLYLQISWRVMQGRLVRCFYRITPFSVFLGSTR